MKFSKLIFVLFLSFTMVFLPSCSDDDEMCVPDTTLQVEFAEVSKIADNHHLAYTDIVIDAPAEEVWMVLTDFDNMSSWSSTLQNITGDISDGGQVVASFILQGQLMEFPHTFIYEEGVLFGWSDPLIGFDGLVDNHIYRVEAISECQTRFIQTDEFQGVSMAITTEDLANLVVPLYQIFNNELKAEVEK